MKDPERRLQELTSKVLLVQWELEEFKKSACNQTATHTDVGTDVSSDRCSPLTNRETQILNYVAEGNANKEIAYALGISTQTVKTHLSEIFRKLNANDRAHAVTLALRNAYLSVDRIPDEVMAGFRGT